MKSEKTLDTLVAASARPAGASKPPLTFLEEALNVFGFGNTSSGFGETLGRWAQRAKEGMERNPALTAGGLLAGTGLLLGSSRARGVIGGVAGLGGLALIASLAYKAFQNYQQNRDPDIAALDPNRATEEDARLYARAMVAAVACDGHVDTAERARIGDGLRQAGLDSESATWIERQLIQPATPEQLAAEAASPAKAAQVYAAARLAIEPDTGPELDFLDRLSLALKIDPRLRGELDRSASSVKT